MADGSGLEEQVVVEATPSVHDRAAFPAPATTVAVVAYFGDDPMRSYQLVQWLPVLELLGERHSVGVVARDPASHDVLAARTSLPIWLAPSFPALRELYADLDPAVVLYVNNSPTNFESLLEPRALHVHVNYGESDKQSMTSNNAKSYDRVFVAGEAAVQRIVTGLMQFDGAKLVRIGRPQLDLVRAVPLHHPVAPATEEAGPTSTTRTVLYAPTWEGEADYNNYTSLDVCGFDVVSALLAVPDVRVIYKPHPRIVGSQTPAIAGAHTRVKQLLEADDATKKDAAGHVVVEEGDILAVMPACDAMVTDVSSVGLDWLYLCTGKPLFITDRWADAETLRREVPVSRCADVLGDGAGEVPVTGAAGRARLTDLVTARLEHDEHHLARVAMRHHYFDGLAVGESSERFFDQVADLVALRSDLLDVPSSQGTAETA